MTERLAGGEVFLSPWWKRTALATMAVGFAVLILLTVKAYENAPPIPAQAVDPEGTAVFTSDDIVAGQQVFLKYGLMNNGTIWGHGAYLGPDFSAQYLHNRALDLADHLATERLGRPYTDLAPEEQAAVDGAVALTLKQNRFDPATGTLTLPDDATDSFNRQIAYWSEYFLEPANNGGLTAGTITDPQELRQLTAFFAWTAWAAAAQRPGRSYSYTNNFPYDPLAGNTPTSGTLLYSAISLIFLLGGTAVVLLAFGKFDYLGWHGRETSTAALLGSRPTDAQCATMKFMAVASLLFLAQTLIGGAVAHYRADPGSFYGIDLAAFLPSNLLRTWHLQLAIFWIATSYVAGALFVAGMLNRREPAGQRLGALPIALAVGLGYWSLWTEKRPVPTIRPASAE